VKVLHVCPLWFPVAEDSPGGIETYLPTLLPALEARGCDSTLLCSGDSSPPAGRVVPVVEENIWRGMETGAVWEYGHYLHRELLMVLERASEFDVIHSHIGCDAYVLSGVPGIRERLLHTQHNPVTRDYEWFVRRHGDLLITAVSEFQARKLREQGARRCRVIPNGIDVERFTHRPGPGEGLVYLGRMEQQKGPDLAVQVARELGLPLTLAGPMTRDVYFDAYIRPWLDDQIRYVGVVDHRRKDELLGGAACVLMPSRWEEPFGLVALEAMACGTPVVALANGALPDLIEPGVTGYLTADEGELAALVRRALELDRSAIREWMEPRFGMSTVARRYRDLYDEIAESAADIAIPGTHVR
jgi:glycosyltransferase involved in cell wall biosynthesis